jgi:hypothetical protein
LTGCYFNHPCDMLDLTYVRFPKLGEQINRCLWSNLQQNSKPSCVIAVGMGENDILDAGGINRE